jgi:hypothetical protein
MTRREAREDVRATIHLSIDVPDLKAGLQFYQTVFGFVENARPFPSMAILDANNVTLCMHEKAAGTKSSLCEGEARRYYEGTGPRSTWTCMFLTWMRCWRKCERQAARSKTSSAPTARNRSHSAAIRSATGSASSPNPEAQRLRLA